MIAGPSQEVGEVVNVLSASFGADPFFEWVFPDSARRTAQIERWWEFMLTRRPPESEMWEIDAHQAAAYWMAPVETPPDSETTAEWEAAFVEMMVDELGDLVAERFEMFGRVTDAHPTEPHWYLSAVGTMPAAQGRGLGAAVVAPILTRCDELGIPAYLESSNPRNLPFYLRLGFRITDEVEQSPDGPFLTCMWREPGKRA